jgi:hypothetical protein
MILEVGKKYKDIEGKIVTIINNVNSLNYPMLGVVNENSEEIAVRTYTKEGKYNLSYEGYYDLTEEHIEVIDNPNKHRFTLKDNELIFKNNDTEVVIAKKQFNVVSILIVGTYLESKEETYYTSHNPERDLTNLIKDFINHNSTVDFQTLCNKVLTATVEGI